MPHRDARRGVAQEHHLWPPQEPGRGHRDPPRPRQEPGAETPAQRGRAGRGEAEMPETADFAHKRGLSGAGRAVSLPAASHCTHASPFRPARPRQSSTHRGPARPRPRRRLRAPAPPRRAFSGQARPTRHSATPPPVLTTPHRRGWMFILATPPWCWPRPHRQRPCVPIGHAPSATPLDPKFCPAPMEAHLYLPLRPALASSAQEGRGAAGTSPEEALELLRGLETPCMKPVFTWRRLQADLRAPASP